MNINLLTKSDIEQILAIEKQSFKRTWARSTFIDELARTDAFFYGVKGSRCRRGNPTFAYLCYRLHQDSMHLLKLAVNPQWRRRGIASFLTIKCLNREAKRGISVSILEVRPSNLSAINFYDQLGFHIIDKRPNYYSDTQEDALIMMKNLKEE